MISFTMLAVFIPHKLTLWQTYADFVANFYQLSSATGVMPLLKMLDLWQNHTHSVTKDSINARVFDALSSYNTPLLLAATQS
jgi:hypothetical protein